LFTHLHARSKTLDARHEQLVIISVLVTNMRDDGELNGTRVKIACRRGASDPAAGSRGGVCGNRRGFGLRAIWVPLANRLGE
jgi:hypothetical protein